MESKLRRIAKDGPSDTANRIPNIKGKPVFKERMGTGTRGKRGGLRLIYYCDDGLALPLFIYKKNQPDVSVKAITEALRNQGIR